MNRVFGLDLFRALSILLVVFGHGNIILFNELTNGIGFPLPDGVEFFFVLSGFLIGQIVLRDFNTQMKFKDLVFFWKRRWFRTLPNYYFALVLNIVFAALGWNGNNIEKYTWEFWLFMQNLYEPFFGFFWESWSLSIEEWFYIFFPLLAFLLLWFRKFPKKNVFLMSILLLIILPLLYKIYLASTLEVDGFFWDVSFRKMVFNRLDTIVYGVLMAFIKVYYFNIWKKLKFPLLVLGLTLLMFNLSIDRAPNDFYNKSFYFVVNSIGAAFLLPFFDSIQKFSNVLGNSITWISKISYSMYVIHFALILQVIDYNACLCNPLNTYSFYLLYWFLTIVLSSILYQYFEIPFMKMRPKTTK